MTVDGGFPNPIACPDDEHLAAYVDRRLDASERRTVESHLARCSACREVVVETIAYSQSDHVTDSTMGRTLPFRRRTWITAGAALAAAAAAVIVWIVRPVGRHGGATTDRPELAELVAVAANEPTRLVEGRLTGGFKYAPPPTASRGPSDSQISPELKIAAAKIESVARQQNAPAIQAALGTAYLMVGDVDRAVDRLEAAVEQAPEDAHFQNDLSVAYLSRASATGRADDWPRALTAAERASTRDPHLVEPGFNRARALEGLHLDAEAADAWSACARADAQSGWAGEARERAQRIQSRLEGTKGKRQGRQGEREEIEDVLLVRWARAATSGDARRAARALADAERRAQALAAGGDRMPFDEVALIRASAPGSNARRALAVAHIAYGRARQAFTAERLREASREMSAAASAFERARSRYAHWGAVYRAISLWVEGSADRSLAELSSIPMDRVPSEYYHLRGRVAWTTAMALETAGRFDLARPAIEQARDQFARGGELEYESVNASHLATADWFLGIRHDMWRNQLHALERVDALPPSPRRNAILWGAAMLALGDRLPEAALAFENHLIRLVHSAGDVRAEPDAYLRRSQILARLGQTSAALADLAHADAATSAIADAGLREWTRAEVNVARAQMLAAQNPEAAISAADAALAFYQHNSGVVRVSELLTARAHAYEIRGDMTKAARDYHAAITALEQDEDRINAPQERKSAFEQQRAAVREAVRFAAVVRRDLSDALSIAERGRARALLRIAGADGTQPMNPAAAYGQLPAGATVVYYAALPDRVIGWVINSTGFSAFSVQADAARLDRMARRLQRRVEENATMAQAADELMFFSAFVRPALRHVAPGATLVFVPDGVLTTVPMAALPDDAGAPLVATHPVLFAPSFTTFVLASERLASFAPDSVVALGDGHDPLATGLPRLAFADAEALAVAQLYPHASALVGREARASQFLAARSSVVHFAGHSVANTDFPPFSRLIFAPDSSTPDDPSGALSAWQVTAHSLPDTAVIVLASCESAAGRFVTGEGVDSLARVFLDAGIPAVVASLWRVDDDETVLMTEFHRRLRATRDAAAALRTAQLRALTGPSDRLPLRRWAGFVVFGGINPQRIREEMTHE